jgi:hypothetical protein
LSLIVLILALAQDESALPYSDPIAAEKDNALDGIQTSEMETLDLLSQLGEGISSTQEGFSAANSANQPQEGLVESSAALEDGELLALLSDQLTNYAASDLGDRAVLAQLGTTEAALAQLELNVKNNSPGTPAKQEASTSSSTAASADDTDANANHDTNNNVSDASAQMSAETGTNVIASLQFGDNITVDLVVQKNNLMDEYLVINTTDSISDSVGLAGQSGASESKTLYSINETNGVESQSTIASNNSNSVLAGLDVALTADMVLNQTAPETNQTETSNEVQSPSDLEDTSALGDSQTATASNQTTTQDTVPVINEDQAIEIKPEVAVEPASENDVVTS